MRCWREDLLAGGCITVATLLLFWNVVLGGETFYGRDIAPFFLPMKAFLAESVRGGDLPLWNPWTAGGEPFLAALQAAPFYPFSALLYAPLSVPLAFDLLLVVHYPLAGMGMYLLLRRWELSFPAALLGGLGFLAGGYLVSLGNFPNNLQTVAWFPWLFLAWDRFLATRGLRSVLAFALLCGVAFLGGEPQMLLLTLLLVLAHGLLRVERNRISAGRQAMGYVAAGALAFGLVAVQLLPFLEYVSHSVRGLDLDLSYSARVSVQPLGLLHLLVPPPLDAGVHGFTASFVLGESTPWLLSLYPGLAVLALAIVGVARGGNRRRTVFWGAVAVLGMALALGQHSPVYRLLHEAVPLVRPFRYPEKFFLATAFALPLLAACGLQALLARRDGRTLLLGTLACTTGLLAVGWIAGAGQILLEGLCGAAPEAPACSRIEEGSALYTAALGRGALVAGGLLAVFALWRTGRLSSPVLAGLVLTVGAVDLLSAHRSVNPSVGRDLYAERTWLERQLDDREGPSLLYRYRATPHWTSMGDIFRVQGAWELTNLYLMHEALGPNRGQLVRRPQQGGLQGIELASEAELIDAGMAAKGGQAVRFLRATGVRYQVDATGTVRRLPGLDSIAAHPELPLVLYRVPDPVPRAHLAGRYKVIPDRRGAFAAALDSGFVLGEEVALDRDPGGPVSSSAAGRVLAAEFGNDDLRFSVQADGPMLLVVNDRWYPGWRAYVDEGEVPVLRANGYFRAVRLPEGEHEVRFRFAPRSFAIGAAISVAVLAVVIVGGVLTARRNL